ncbi:MAG: cyclic nucleotide-binding domain-containing protein [Candidatus Delongbacteria bacterium]|nr:cyclic nucleotide-binding domain-containing protein [Candidatus Delongbacteria bacterium]MCG2760407.1 cyclic nucleotide-binding domain-containing protein [Candidatus Delongbacteria bacterium]
MSTTVTIAMLALIWGLVSAVSLPLGAVIGIWSKPTQKVTSSLMAFGGGALLFALTIELFAHSLHLSHEGHDKLIIISTMIGAVFGGLVFELLNQILNNKGAFLRKSALLKKYVSKKKTHNVKQLIESLSKVRFLQMLPAEEVVQIIPYIKTRGYSAGETIFKQGEEGRELFFIISGNVRIIRECDGEKKDIAELSSDDVFGEIALISDSPRTATVQAIDDVKLFVIQKADFDYLFRNSPALHDEGIKLMEERLNDISVKDYSFKNESAQWQKKAQSNLSKLSISVSSRDMDAEVKEHQGGGAAMAIWLGIALDGIPESLVIGMLTVAAAAANRSMSFAFIAGVFLANLPEAMSSAVTMQKQGSGFKKIFWMWMSLCIMTGAGAMIGALVFPAHPEGTLRYFISGIEGMAAGAMLTMIANTMLPEAYEHGGSAVAGLSTLIGFIAALCVKIMG